MDERIVKWLVDIKMFISAIEEINELLDSAEQ